MQPSVGNPSNTAIPGGTQTFTMDSTAVYREAYSTFFSQISSLHNPLPPIPSSLPHPKLIPNTRFIVDGFKFAGDFSVSYFLTHFHSDHYTGLSSSWSKGLIYCSPITARLLIEVLKVPKHFVVQLPLNERLIIDACDVFLVDANHCPGAVQFLFKVPGSDDAVQKYIHTGDFRYCDSMKSVSSLNEFIGADAVYLDTTYCNPKFLFPSQEESIAYIVNLINTTMADNHNNLKNVLFLISTYVIGKEKILTEVSRRCNMKIHVDNKKMSILKVLGLGDDGVFTLIDSQSNVHVVSWNVLGETWPYFRPNFIRMKEIMEEKGYIKVIGFVPTGWSYEVKKKNKFAVKSKDSFEIHLVPYSEHSNYDELREYIKFLKPKRVVPTVGMDIDELDSKQANGFRKHFDALIDVTAVKHEFLKPFHLETRAIIDVKNEQDTENPSLLETGIVGSGYTEGYIQELTGCLPSWVNENQMLHLFKKFGEDLVEAVSYFYEHETEFHEEIKDSTIEPPALPLKITQIDPVLPTLSTRNESKGLSGSKIRPSNQLSRLPISLNRNKSGASTGKRKKSTVKKRNKKTKSNQSNGPKQCTITKFFNKVVPLVSQEDEASVASSQSHNDDDT